MRGEHCLTAHLTVKVVQHQTRGSLCVGELCQSRDKDRGEEKRREERREEPLQLSQSLLANIRLRGLQSTAPRQNPYLQSLMMKLSPLVLEQNGMTGGVVTAVAKSAGEARPPGIAECCVMTKSELAESPGGESSDEAGPLWSGAIGTSSTAATATFAESVGEARPPGLQSAVPT